MGRLMIGAPVHQRAWILEAWFEHLAAQWEFPPEDVTVVLNYGESSDTTLDVIEQAATHYGFHEVKILFDDGEDHVAGRNWSDTRYRTMVRLRNDLLAHVRNKKPELYLSCDTDMLLPPSTVLKLAQEMGRIGADGIAPLTYMTPTGTQFPNCMNRGGVTRPLVQADTMVVGACFGVVLMNPELYSRVDYAVHPNGEDLGWAANVEKENLTLALTPHVRVKHVMHPGMLSEVDHRVGF